MVNILVIKNGPVVILSYLLNYIKKKHGNVKITVLVHEHAYESIVALKKCDQVIAYHSKEIFLLNNFNAEEIEELTNSSFDFIYFIKNKTQQNGFENLISIAQKVSNKKTTIVGLSSENDEYIFTKKRLANLTIKKQITYLAATIFFLINIIALIIFIPISYLRSSLAKR